MEELSYEEIIDYVASDFDEDMGEFNFTVIEVTAKIIEEHHFIFRENPFIKYAYLVRLGLESIARGEIADYLYEKLATIDPIIAAMKHKEIASLKSDLTLYQRKQKKAIYDIIETPFPTKASADYHLGDGLYKENDSL